MAKKTTKKTTKASTSVALPETTEPEGGALVSAFQLASPQGLDLAIEEAKMVREHVGGSLPLIAFKGQKQEAFVGKFVGIAFPEGQDFTLATFDLLDHGKWLSGKFPEVECKIARVQIVNGHAVRPWTSSMGDVGKNGKAEVLGPNEGNVGKIVLVKYLGEQGTNKTNPLKLVTIEELSSK